MFKDNDNQVTLLEKELNSDCDCDYSVRKKAVAIYNNVLLKLKKRKPSWHTFLNLMNFTEWFLYCIKSISEKEIEKEHFDSKKFISQCNNQIRKLMQDHLTSEYTQFIDELGGWADFEHYVKFHNYKPGFFSNVFVNILTAITVFYIFIYK